MYFAWLAYFTRCLVPLGALGLGFQVKGPAVVCHLHSGQTALTYVFV